MKKSTLLFTSIFLINITFLSNPCSAQIDLGDTMEKAKEKTEGALEGKDGKNSNLTREEVVKGLKEALRTAAKKSAEKVSQKNGFLDRPAIKIPFPPEAKEVKQQALSLGMKSQVDKFVTRLNRAAEKASEKAAPIFLDAIKDMSINEAFDILNGSDTAATHYLRNNTTSGLTDEFLPIVKDALDEVHITRYWKPLAKKYNKTTMLTGKKNVNPDLDQYVTHKAIDGLFYMVGQEEGKIRKDPQARVTDILEKVFSEQD